MLRPVTGCYPLLRRVTAQRKLQNEPTAVARSPRTRGRAVTCARLLAALRASTSVADAAAGNVRSAAATRVTRSDAALPGVTPCYLVLPRVTAHAATAKRT